MKSSVLAMHSVGTAQSSLSAHGNSVCSDVATNFYPAGIGVELLLSSYQSLDHAAAEFPACLSCPPSLDHAAAEFPACVSCSPSLDHAAAEFPACVSCS